MSDNAETTTVEKTEVADDGLIFSSKEVTRVAPEPEHEETEESHEEPAEENDDTTEDSDDSVDSHDEDEEPPLPEHDEDYDDTKKKKNVPEWVRKRIERERIALEEVQRKNSKLEAELASRISQITPDPVTQNAQYNYLTDPNRPMRDNFASDEEFFLAVSDYRDAKRQNDFQNRARQEHYNKAESEFQRKIKETKDQGQEKYGDFDEKTHEILRGDFPSNRAMAEAIVGSTYKDDILYYLGSNMDTARKIGNSNPIEAVREITKIEMRFEARKKANITKAPKIIAPLSGKGGLASPKDPQKMDQGSFEDWYQKKYNVKRMV